MQLQVMIIACVAFLIIRVNGNGWNFNPFLGGQIPPGLQYNPFFNGQNPNPPSLQYNPFLNGQNPSPGQPHPIFNGHNPFFNQNPHPNNPFLNIPPRNFSYYPPFISNFAHKNNSSFNVWNNNPFFARRSLQKRALGDQPRYSPYYCIPDNYPQCNGSHSFSIGCLSPWDKTLFRQCYVKPGKFFWKREKIVNYPGDFLPPGFIRNETITAIKVQDRDCNGTGGYAQIKPGTGVGYRNVSVSMYSTGARKGFNICLQIFGK